MAAQSETPHTYQMFIGGKWVPSHSERTYPVHNPALGHVLAQVPKGDREDVRAAVDSARRAFEDPSWRNLDPSKRGRILYKIGSLLRDKLPEIAKLETMNNGKPFGQAKGDVAQSARHFEYFAGMADKIQGSTIPVPGNRLNYTVKEPIGVTAHIVPWNYPLVMAARSLAPALAAGDTCVAKPASFTPLTLLKLAEVCKEAGLPDGVFNVVTGGGREVGEALAEDPQVKLVALTGSVETGVRISEIAAPNLTKLALELGGKNPNIVFADADLAEAAQGVLNGIFTNAGQMCWAGSRLVVEDSVAEKLVASVVDGAKSIKLGNGLDPETKMGPLVAESQRDRVSSYVESGIQDGAKVAAGGRLPTTPGLLDGYFYEPTVLTDVTPAMKVVKEEIFGPVLTVSTFSTLDQCLDLANGTDYGLWAGIWTRDIGRAHRTARELDAGIVTINEEPITFPQTPFGGYKRSGNSTEQGMDAIASYVRVKNVSVNLE